MKNFQLLLKWLEETPLSISSVDEQAVCYVKLKSKRFGALEYTLCCGLKEEEVLLFNLSLPMPPVPEHCRRQVSQLLLQLNGSVFPDHWLEWWMGDAGDLYLLHLRRFPEGFRKSGRPPMLTYIMEFMVDAADAHYLELVQLIVPPVRQPADPYVLLSFMKETLLRPDRSIRLNREGTSWSADRFRGRLSGWLWALVEARKSPEVNLTEMLDRLLLLEVGRTYAQPQEWQLVERLREQISHRRLLNDRNYADGELGKWEGMAVYYRGWPTDCLCREEEIEI